LGNFLKRYWVGVFLVIVSGICYGLTPILAAYAYQEGATVCVHLFLRFSFATAFFLTYIAIFKRNSLRVVARITLIFLLAAGIFEFAASYLYIASVQYVSAGLVALLFYTHLIWVAIWGYLFKGERLKLSGIVGIALALIGLVMLVGISLGKIHTGGIFMALVAALICSGYVMFSNRVLEDLEPIFTTAFICLLCTVLFYVTGRTTGTLNFQISSTAWLASIASAILTGNIAMFAFLAGMKRIGSTTATVLCTVEPITAVVCSALLLSQKMTALQLLGGLVIIIGAALVVTSKKPPNARSDKRLFARLNIDA
jgi:drug/metabolite transporter (DMT)-like permease